MAFKSKYKGIEIENLLDLVAAGNSGSVGDFSLYLTKEEAEALYAKSNNSFVVANGIIDNEGVSYYLPTSDSEDLQHVLSTKWDIEQLSEAAKSGSYTDLINTPDLITEIKMNGVVKGTSGSIDLGTVITDVSGKVDKVLGKDLSTHDFTTELKTKLEGLSNYDDYELSMAISQLRTDFDQLVSGDTTTAIKTFNEIIAFLDGISDTQDLDSILANIEQQIASKQAIISDLNAIRSGANKGETSVQPNDISDFLTVDDIAQVATSGSYNDLTDKPTIPSAVTESTVSGWGFTKNAGTYSKPSTGIPKSDLASAVQTSLGKADTALQSYTEQYKGTVTAVKINGTTKSQSNGIVDLGTVITAHQDIGGKQDKLVSGTNIKTINGTSILGSGNITISGGGSSSGGEDIRYFTEFTVEDFIEACETNYIITSDTTELFNAMKSNKVICVPYRGYDKGFIVASYQSGENVEYPCMYLQKGGVEYYAWTGDSHELVGEYPTYNSVQVVEMAGGEVILECLDNHIYIITDPVDYLFPFVSQIQKGITINFMSGEFGTTMETYDAFWANGEIPQIEPNTYYELSLMQNVDGGCNIVLTPFESV